MAELNTNQWLECIYEELQKSNTGLLESNTHAKDLVDSLVLKQANFAKEVLGLMEQQRETLMWILKELKKE